MLAHICRHIVMAHTVAGTYICWHTFAGTHLLAHTSGMLMAVHIQDFWAEEAVDEDFKSEEEKEEEDVPDSDFDEPVGGIRRCPSRHGSVSPSLTQHCHSIARDLDHERHCCVCIPRHSTCAATLDIALSLCCSQTYVCTPGHSTCAAPLHTALCHGTS